MTAEVASTLERTLSASVSSLETCLLREEEEEVVVLGALRALMSWEVFFERSLANDRVKS